MYFMIGLLVSLCHIPRENKRKEGVLFSVQPMLVSMTSLLELSDAKPIEYKFLPKKLISRNTFCFEIGDLSISIFRSNFLLETLY